jgi:hypothetical protein
LGIAAAAAEWQPEQDAAPGGGAEAAGAGTPDATIIAKLNAMRSAFISTTPQNVEAAAP